MASTEELKGTDTQRYVKKRENYLTWPDYFMSIAFLSAQRSKDPNTQVGACIVNTENKIVGIGYNGMPNGCADDLMPWNRVSDSWLETKHPYVCHAELNAVLNKNSADVKGCTIYVALFPCNECAKIVIQSGIKKVVYFSDKLIVIDFDVIEKNNFASTTKLSAKDSDSGQDSNDSAVAYVPLSPSEDTLFSSAGK